jgi:hypothetical protein
MAALPRDIDRLDLELRIERSIWLVERRAGEASAGAAISLRRLDALLDERTLALHLLRRNERRTVTGPRV